MRVKIVKLGDVTSPRKEKVDPKNSDLTTFVGLEHVESNTGRLLESTQLDSVRSSAARIHEGDVIYSRLRPYLNKVHLAESDFAGSAEFIVFPSQQGLSQRYLKYALMSPRFLAFAAILDTGDRPRVTWDGIKNFELPLPPIERQHEIVERIESALAKLERSGNQIDEVLLRLEDARRATLRDAFEPAEAIPKRDWQETSLGDVVSIGRRKPSELKDSHDEVSFLPMAAVEEVSGVLNQSERISHIAAQQKTLTYFVEGDVLFAKVTPCMENGKVTLAKNLYGGCGYGSTEFFPVVPSDRIRGDFLRYFLLNNKFREEAARSMTGAVGLKRVPRTFIESYPIHLPPLGQQESIVQKLEESLSAIGALRSTAIDVRKDISLIKRSLLHQAFASQEESSV